MCSTENERLKSPRNTEFHPAARARNLLGLSYSKLVAIGCSTTQRNCKSYKIFGSGVRTQWSQRLLQNRSRSGCRMGLVFKAWDLEKRLPALSCWLLDSYQGIVFVDGRSASVNGLRSALADKRAWINIVFSWVSQTWKLTFSMQIYKRNKTWKIYGWWTRSLKLLKQSGR